MNRKILRLFTILIWLIALVVEASDDGKRKVTVHRPDLDIALLFDESSSMGDTDYKRVYNGMREWVKGYFVKERINKTRFAVVGCGSTDPNVAIKLRFSDYQTADIVNKKIPDTVLKKNNYYYCLEMTKKKVFGQKEDRLGVPNVILCKYKR